MKAYLLPAFIVADGAVLAFTTEDPSCLEWGGFFLGFGACAALATYFIRRMGLPL